MSREGTEASTPRLLELGTHSPPFERNASAWSQRVPIALLALVATGMSVHLGLFQWGVTDSVWDPVFGDGSETVLTSDESEAMHRLIGIPDAMLGAWAYLTEVVLSLAGSTRRWQFRPWMVVLFGIDVIPLGIVSSVLVVLQGVSIGSWCFLCLMTAAISLTLVAFAYDEVWACLKYLYWVWDRERDPRLLRDVFLGRASDRAYRLALEYEEQHGVARGGSGPERQPTSAG